MQNTLLKLVLQQGRIRQTETKAEVRMLNYMELAKQCLHLQELCSRYCQLQQAPLRNILPSDLL